MKDKKTMEPHPIESDEEMTENKYRRLLLELSSSSYWEAILLHSRSQDRLCVDSLRSLDPSKEPTLVARMQGMSSGLFSLEKAVNTIIVELENKNNNNKKDNTNMIP